MRIPVGPTVGLMLITAILAATLFDLARVGAHALQPWLGWMLP